MVEDMNWVELNLKDLPQLGPSGTTKKPGKAEMGSSNAHRAADSSDVLVTGYIDDFDFDTQKCLVNKKVHENAK